MIEDMKRGMGRSDPGTFVSLVETQHGLDVPDGCANVHAQSVWVARVEVQLGVVQCEDGCRKRELHGPGSTARHELPVCDEPIELEVGYFGCNLGRRLRCVAQGDRSDAVLAGEERIPKLIAAGADGADRAEAGDDDAGGWRSGLAFFSHRSTTKLAIRRRTSSTTGCSSGSASFQRSTNLS